MTVSRLTKISMRNFTLLCGLLMIFAFGLTLALPVSAQPAHQKLTVLVPGEYFKEVLPDKLPTQGWLGLAGKESVWQLAPATVRAKPSFYMAQNEKTPNALDIRVRDPATLLLLKIPGLSAGPLKVVQPNLKQWPDHNIDIKNVIKLPFDGGNYFLSVKKSGRLWLSQNNLQSPLSESKINNIEVGEEAARHAQLLWAGDLNRDGGLDVVVSFSSLYSINTCVFLSSGLGSRWRISQKHCFQSYI